jgi:CO/xanthine dehydrogenase Mo-binding subunit
VTLDRRELLTAGLLGGASLLIACRPSRGQSASALAPNAFVRIDPDETVTIRVAKSEIGQGVKAALAALVAEELDADWARVRVEQAEFDPRYGEQETGGSSSVRTSWEPLREAGGTARAMLVAAAAASWKVTPATCRSERGFVVHPPSGRRASYGQLASAAARLPVPAKVALKDPKDFTLIGKPLARLDAPDLVTGAATYGIDVRRPGMRYASIERSPTLGGTLERVDDSAARAVAGVRDVVTLPTGVAVVADSTWAAISGRRALKLTWRAAATELRDSAAIHRLFEASAQRTGAVAEERGTPAATTTAGDVPRLEATYELAFLAHATMEPLACTVDARPGHCEIWAPTQKPRAVHEAARRILGLSADQVRVHVTLMGGGFGRRLESDFAIEAIELAKRVRAPVQVVWTREDDLAHGFCRPASLHRLTARLGDTWEWTHRIVAPSVILQRWTELKDELGAWINNGLDETAVLGATKLPYDLPRVRIEYVAANTPVPIGWWRGTYDSLNAFANECFLDEIAAATREDPYQLRRRLLHKSPRHLAVLELAASKAGWGTPPPPGRFRGLALHTTVKVPVAHVVELSVTNGSIRVHRVISAVDCGLVVDPAGAAAQIEGSIADGLTSALKAAITVSDGRIAERTFHDYPLLRLDEMPAVEVHFVPSSAPPLGLGEPGLAPVAPAVANALFAATGRRLRRLPIRPTDLVTK